MMAKQHQMNRELKSDAHKSRTNSLLFMSNQCERVSDPSNPSRRTHHIETRQRKISRISSIHFVICISPLRITPRSYRTKGFSSDAFIPNLPRYAIIALRPYALWFPNMSSVIYLYAEGDGIETCVCILNITFTSDRKHKTLRFPSVSKRIW